MWEDWRDGSASVYWTDLTDPTVQVPIAASPGYEGLPDIGNSRVAYSTFRTTTTVNGKVHDVYNVWSQALLPYMTVVP